MCQMLLGWLWVEDCWECISFHHLGLWWGYWTYSALLFSTAIHLLVQANSWMANWCLLWALPSELADPVIFSLPNRPFDYIHQSPHICISGQFITESSHQFHQALTALCDSMLIVADYLFVLCMFGGGFQKEVARCRLKWPVVTFLMSLLKPGTVLAFLQLSGLCLNDHVFLEMRGRASDTSADSFSTFRSVMSVCTDLNTSAVITHS